MNIDKNSRIIGAEYIPDLSAICIATDIGDVIIFELGSKKLEVVGTIDTGITAMKWSPDYEVVVFTTKEATFLLMTLDFDVLLEENLIPENELSTREKSHVSLYGTAPSPLPSEQEVDVTVPPKISWRGDGNYFAISTFEGGNACFRVWERSGTFHSKSEENVKGQQNFIAWRPSGEILASFQENDNVKQIIFFEKNGLRHYEFPLRDSDATLIDIQWNAEGDVLALVLECGEGSEKESLIQLWTTKNYHWYLKQEFRYNHSKGEKLKAIQWNNESSMCLHAYFSNGLIIQFNFCWDVYESVSKRAITDNTFNESLIAVIDGTKLLLTPFKRMTTPPPMSATSIDIKDIDKKGKINLVTFDIEKNNIIVFTSTGYLIFYSAYKPIINKDKPSIFNCSPSVIGFIQDDNLRDIRHAVGLNETSFLLVKSLEDGQDVLVTYHVVINDGKIEIKNTIEKSIPSNMKIFRVCVNPNSGNIFVEFDDGKIYRYDITENKLSREGNLNFPAVCSWIKPTTFCDEEVIVGLTRNSKLYIKGDLISNECNSFYIGSDYLMFTTLTHTLRFMALHLTIQENLSILEHAKTRKHDDSIRELEQGSYLITSVYHGTRVVLQLPRGNLEIIDPRALVLHLTRKLLNETRYQEAFLLMRKHRIDLNFLYDHNPQLFMQNLDKFVAEVDNIEYLNLFISGLKDEDVTKTTYVDVWKTHEEKSGSLVSAATIAKRSGLVEHVDSKKVREKLHPYKIGKDQQNSGKVNNLCDSLRVVFERSADSKEKYLLCILTTLVCKKPPEIASALSFVQKIRNDELEQGIKTAISSEKALKYLTFLIDVNLLYDIALGMYDFDLVLLVAQKTQKDPREYLPFLANLQKLPMHYQRYKIDEYLKRWDKALENLSKDEEDRFNECLVLIEKHNLYMKAIELFKNDDKKLFKVYEIYGDFFFSKKDYHQAALVYNSGNHFEKSLKCYQLLGDWKKAITTAHRMGMKDSELSNLYLELANSLKSLYRYEDASELFEYYCKDINEALTCLILGSLWSNAIMFCYKYGMTEKIDTDIKPALLTSKDALLKQINESTVKIMKYHNRLITLRANKYLQSQNETTPEVEGSETSSMYSGSDSSSRSGRSFYSQSSRSSKRSRKKPSKKKISGRKGSPYEEEYLMQELPQLLPTEKLQEDVNNHLKHLYEFGYTDDCKELQKSLQVLIDYATKAKVLLSSVSPKTREELDEEEKKVKDPLLNTIFNPVNIPNVNFPVIDWKLKTVGI